MSGSGDITVWINSPGGDCVAAAQIYNMLLDYHGNVTVKVDGIAASAASVIAMAGNKVMMSPVSMLMIHNPATIAMGDHVDMEKAIDMLESVKDSIINAYADKTGLSRSKLSHMMDCETWMDATKAIELGFADEIMSRTPYTPEPKKEEAQEDESETNPDEESEKTTELELEKDEAEKETHNSMLFSRRTVNNTLLNKMCEHIEKTSHSEPTPKKGRSVDELMERLNLIKY